MPAAAWQSLSRNERKFADRDWIDWPRPARAPALLFFSIFQVAES
jgi:hypothetical protein